MVRRSFLLLVLCLMTARANAATLSAAREINLHSVSIVRLLVDTPRNLVYAVTDEHELIVRSLESSDWRLLTTSVVMCVIDEPTGRVWGTRGSPGSNADLGYAEPGGAWQPFDRWGRYSTGGIGGGGGVLLAASMFPYRLWRSVDGGTSWADITTGSGLPSYFIFGGAAVQPGHPDHLFLLDGNGMLVSFDSGASWVKCGLIIPHLSPQPIYPRQLLFDPSDANTIFAVYGGALCVSRDAGRTWKELIPTGIPPICYTSDYCDYSQLVRAIAVGGDRKIYAATWNGFFASTNRGGFWTRVSLPDNPIVQTVDASGSVIAVGTSSPGMLLSKDGGASWSSTRANFSSKITSCTVDASDPRHLFAAASSIAFSSDDGGVTWQEHHGGLESVYPGSSLRELSVDPLDSSHIAGVMGETLTISHDGSASWNFKTPPIHGMGDPVGTKILSVDWTNSTFYLVSVRGLHRRRFSEDSWTTLGAGIIDAGRTNGFVADPHDPSTLYIGMSDYGVFVSRDSGVTWQGQSEGFAWPQAFNVYSMTADPVSGRIYAGTSYGIYVTDDQAHHWRRFSEIPAWPQQQLVFDPRSSNLYASATTGDESVLWEISSDGLRNSRVALPFHDVITRLSLGGGGRRMVILTASGRAYTIALRSRPARRR